MKNIIISNLLVLCLNAQNAEKSDAQVQIFMALSVLVLNLLIHGVNRMESVHKVKTETTMILTEDESLWLHRVMQNPLHGEDPDEEDGVNRDMRGRFFRATQPGIKHFTDQ